MQRMGLNKDGMYIITSQRHYRPNHANEWEVHLSMEHGAWTYAYYANTEPEAIFKACTYILEQTKQKD